MQSNEQHEYLESRYSYRQGSGIATVSTHHAVVNRIEQRRMRMVRQASDSAARGGQKIVKMMMRTLSSSSLSPSGLPRYPTWRSDVETRERETRRWEIFKRDRGRDRGRDRDRNGDEDRDELRDGDRGGAQDTDETNHDKVGSVRIATVTTDAAITAANTDAATTGARKTKKR